MPGDLQRRVEGVGVPHDSGQALVDAVGPQEVAGRIRAVDLDWP
jgi:hypothetical protein